MAKKRTRKRRRRRNPGTAMSTYESNPRRRRRRRKSNPGKSRRRRRNPGLLGGRGGGLIREFEGFLPRFAGKLIAAVAAKRFGGGSLFQPPTSSVFAGTSWSGQQYLAAAIGVMVGAAILPRFAPRLFNARAIRQGGFDAIFTKFLWTEGIARSKWATWAFGQSEGQIRVDPSSGQTYLYQGGQWQAMQGAYGDTLVSAGPLDDTLVTASPLDGTLVRASPLDYGGIGYRVNSNMSDADKFKTLYAS